jgi:hypothetical protein
MSEFSRIKFLTVRTAYKCRAYPDQEQAHVLNRRQCAEYTRSGFRWRDGRLFLAKMGTPLAFIWSWPGIDPATIDPTTVTVSRDPCGRWYVAFAVDIPSPDPLPAAGQVPACRYGVRVCTHAPPWQLKKAVGDIQRAGATQLFDPYAAGVV